ncbi:erythrocyte membrane protein 1, PfEMP1, putative [Plasmodium sp.]|nr:erythrocyte membrane protein 1, PfEMP1, putative [Plasmodium sp.]
MITLINFFLCFENGLKVSVLNEKNYMRLWSRNVKKLHEIKLQIKCIYLDSFIFKKIFKTCITFPSQPLPPQNDEPINSDILSITILAGIAIALSSLAFLFMKKKPKSTPIDILRIIDISPNEYGRQIYGYIYMVTFDTTVIILSENEYEELDINNIYPYKSPKYKTLIETPIRKKIPFITSIHDRDLHNADDVIYNINMDVQKNENFSTNIQNMTISSENDLYSRIDLISD